ncbi:MAG: hypothetical protein PHQ04_00845 [Opitutaceae bacterium]|nr:hypothetical protein [Opitutaceae bacterium]
MSLFLATLLPGLLLVLIGALLLWNNPVVSDTARALPRSRRAAILLYGGGALWFLARISRLSEADLIFFQSPWPVFCIFAALAILAFIYVPDFLAVRGLCILMLMVAEPLLRAAYMEYAHPQRLLMVSAVYLGLVLALYLSSVPYRLRDILEWLFRRPGRPRLLGAVLLVYGLATSAAAFTY